LSHLIHHKRISYRKCSDRCNYLQLEMLWYFLQHWISLFSSLCQPTCYKQIYAECLTTESQYFTYIQGALLQVRNWE
jgi:hypothetical protein